MRVLDTDSGRCMLNAHLFKHWRSFVSPRLNIGRRRLIQPAAAFVQVLPWQSLNFLPLPQGHRSLGRALAGFWVVCTFLAPAS